LTGTIPRPIQPISGTPTAWLGALAGMKRLRYGDGNPYRSLKLYGQQNKDEFYRGCSELLRTLPLPRRFVGKIRGPSGAQVYQSCHVGILWQPDPHARQEQYWGNAVHVL
jgi:hypothetical protein